METVIIFIMVMVGFNFLLKLTTHKIVGILATSLVAALFTGLLWDEAAGQSKAQIADWIENPQLMLDISVILTVDVFFQVAFCIMSVKKLSGSAMTKSEKLILAITQWIPGLLIFPVLFALLVELIFSFPGTDFATIGWSLAGAVMIVSPLGALFLRWLLPEKELRLELMFMVNMLIAILGIVATVNGRTAVNGTNSVEWGALAGVLSLLLGGTIAGIFLYKRKMSKLTSQIK